MTLLLLPALTVAASSQVVGQDQVEDQPSSPDENLPSSIRSDLKQYEREIDRAFRQYLAAAEKARKKAIAALEKDMDTSLERKDLETAVVIKGEIEKLTNADLWLAGKPTKLSLIHI